MGIATLERATLVMLLRFNQLLFCCFSLFCTSICTGQSADAPVTSSDHLIVVVGAAGEEEYKTEFSDWAKPWCDLAKQRKWQLTLIDGESELGKVAAEGQGTLTSHEALQRAIAVGAKSTQRLWIVLLGHGTYSRSAAKFNLVGPDVSAQELSTWLKTVSSQVIVVNCSSSSAPFLTELAGKNRVLITATRAGSEVNFSRFGKYLSQAIGDLSADIDHDKEVSLLEAFLAATSQTERFYREDARLITEHALLDDNADKAGTSGDFYRGIRPAKDAAKGKKLDGASAARIILFSSPDAPQLSPEMEQQRAQVETAIDTLRNAKSNMTLEAYYAALEQLLLELSGIYDRCEANL